MRCFQGHERGYFACDCKNPKKKDMAHLELEAKYNVLLKKQSTKVYTAEGKCWDDFDSDENGAEFYNYALMANFRNDKSSNQVPILTIIDMSVEEYKHPIEKLSIDMFNIHTSMTSTNEKMLKSNTKMPC